MLGDSASPNAAVAVAAGGNLVLASTMTVGSVGYTLPGYDLVMLADDNASFSGRLSGQHRRSLGFSDDVFDGRVSVGGVYSYAENDPTYGTSGSTNRRWLRFRPDRDERRRRVVRRNNCRRDSSSWPPAPGA